MCIDLFSLSTSLQIAGYALMREYGKQFRKVLHYICKQYVPRSVSSYSHADSFSRGSYDHSLCKVVCALSIYIEGIVAHTRLGSRHAGNAQG